MFYLLYYKDKWSPALQIRTVLLSIQALLSAPNPDDPLANDVAEKWKVDEKAAIEEGKIYIYFINIRTRSIHRSSIQKFPKFQFGFGLDYLLVSTIYGRHKHQQAAQTEKCSSNILFH